MATKNHQGGLDSKGGKSNSKIFKRPGAKRCPVKLIEKYLSHLNPECSSLFQKPRSPCKSFNPARDAVWYCLTPLGHNTLDNMLCFMTTRAGIIPHLTNYSIRATNHNGSICCQHRKLTHQSNNRGSKRSQHPELLSHSNIRAVQNNVKQAWLVIQSGR